MNNLNNQSNSTSSTSRGKRGFKTAAIAAVSGVALLVAGALYAPAIVPSKIAAAQDAGSAQAGLTAMQQSQDALAALYSKVSPSVVSIQVVEDSSQTADQGTLPQLPQIPGMPTPPGSAPNAPATGEGSGWIYDNDGHIVTNNHVVDGAKKVVVTFSNGMWANAEVVARDPQADLAVIKVTPPAGFDWKPLPLADNGSLKVGHTVIAIGNPFGYENTMTQGIVSALGRGFPTGSFGSNRYTLPDVIQTDAAINPGNSGGPLLDLNGNVVGVNFAIESAVRSNSGVGFTIPVSIVKLVVPDLIKNGGHRYAYLGLQGTTITGDLAETLGLEPNKLGVYVSSVIPDGPADKGGVKGGSQPVQNDMGLEVQKGGDVIVGIGDQTVRRFEDLVGYLVESAKPGDKVTLTVLRDGKEQKIELTLGERPSQLAAASSSAKPSQPSQPNQPTKPNQPSQPNKSGQINARAAITVAEAAVKEKNSLSGDITEKVATPDQRDGKSVWVVELSDGSQTATVVVDATTGDVLSVDVK